MNRTSHVSQILVLTTEYHGPYLKKHTHKKPNFKSIHVLLHQVSTTVWWPTGELSPWPYLQSSANHSLLSFCVKLPGSLIVSSLRVFFLPTNIRIRIHLLARRNLLWDILRLPSSCRAALGLYVILTLWRGRGANQPPYALLHIGARHATYCATGDKWHNAPYFYAVITSSSPADNDDIMCPDEVPPLLFLCNFLFMHA